MSSDRLLTRDSGLLVPSIPGSIAEVDLESGRVQLTREERRDIIAELCKRFQRLLGFQEASVRNQAEHLEALWSSFLSWNRTSDDVDPDQALLELGESLLRSQRAWAARVWTPLFDDGDSTWDPLSSACLFLLVWGEMGNLRFCPELVSFVFTAARAYCDGVAHAASSRPEGAFLEEVVRPIFNVMLAETFDNSETGPAKFKFGRAPAPAGACNYDDWNELFWDPDQLGQCLVLKDGSRLRSYAPKDVWPMLKDVDWARSFGRKSHREVHSPLPLLVSHYRIFYIHAQVFLITVVAWYAYRIIHDGAGNVKPRENWPEHLWIMIAGCGAVSPVFMMVHEVGFQILTPSLHLRSRFRNLAKLLLFDMTPAYTFSTVLLLQRGILPMGDFWYEIWNIRFTNTDVALVVHLLIALVFMVSSIHARSSNFYQWAFYPKIKSYPRLSQARLFWLATLALALTVNAFAVGKLVDSAMFVVDGYLPSYSDTWLLVMAWAYLATMALPCALCFYACTLLILRFMIAVVGGAIGWRRLRSARLSRLRKGFSWKSVPEAVTGRVLHVPAATDALEAGTPDNNRWWRRMSDPEFRAFVETWNTLVTELREQDYLTDAEADRMRFAGTERADDNIPGLFLNAFTPKSLPVNPEAKRRLVTLARSCQMNHLPTGKVDSMPMLSVLIPHYAETILYWKRDLFKDGCTDELLRFLIKYKRHEWESFCQRTCRSIDAVATHHQEANTSMTSFAPREIRLEDLEEAICRWASLRMQTLWRTVESFNRSYFLALETLLRHQEPELDTPQREDKILDKFQMVVAVQQYAKFANPKDKSYDPFMIAAVEQMLEEFGSWLCISFIEEVMYADEEGNQVTKWYSCMVDGNCAKVQLDVPTPAGMWFTGPLKREPRFRIELPGFPILGHGKSDNQNCAIIFTRGEIVQTIDANQEAYFESSLFLPLALQEFENGRQGSRRPGIVGFREHIFSDVGLLGTLAAESEFTFGTIFQRTMNSPLGARLHYGHPDMMDKLQVMQQGGISKGTRGLNLSEDVFAGLDLTLREGWSVFREYFYVGKGRDMGFLSCLSFYAKVSMGNAEQCLTRQWMRMGLGLPISRLLGVYYTHLGYYVNQCIQIWALKAFCFMTAFAAVATEVDPAFAGPARAVASFYVGGFFFLYFSIEMIPLLTEKFIENGLRAVVKTVLYTVCTFSFVFWPFQSKYMAHSFETTLLYGGALYIPTGRGLATKREPFGKLFRYFLNSHFKDAAEAVVLLLFGIGQQINSLFYVMLGISIFSWLTAPFLFNPKQFKSVRGITHDLSEWTSWMFGTDSSGNDTCWSVWASNTQQVRRNGHWTLVLIPSGRLCALLISTAMIMALTTREQWGNKDVRLALAPPICFTAVCLVYGLLSCLFSGKALGTRYAFLASLAVASTTVEVYLVDPSFRGYGVLLHKFCWIRFLLELCDGIAAHARGGWTLRWLHESCRYWALSWRWARDFLIGVCLTAFLYLVACFPGFNVCQHFCLFHATATKDSSIKDAALEAQQPDGRELSLAGYEDNNEALLEFLRSNAPQLVPS